MPESVIAYLDTVGAQATALAAALAGGVFGLQKAMKVWHGNANDVAYTRAEGEILNGMREELTRMHEQNSKLAAAVNSLQDTLIDLKMKLSTFESENASMRMRLSTQCSLCEYNPDKVG
jgi:predicted RNase H-like nuclease (RuvC/YqgF family)